MKKKKIAIFLMFAIIAAAFVPSVSYAQEEVPYGPWVDQISFQAESDQAKVFNMLENNEVQLHISDINDPGIFAKIRESPNLDYATSYGLYFDLTFNPYGPTFLNGELNPFYDPKIREAMNYLIDRDYIAEELMGGMAKPKLFCLTSAFPDYGRLADVLMQLEAKYSHNFEKAKTIIFEEMAKLGAVYKDEKWYYNDKPVTLKILIRIDSPPRTRIGNYVADLLEQLGFKTERMYKTSREASPIWILGNPAKGEFHIYTGGWITTIVNRDQAGNFAFFYTPRGGWGTPLWQAYKPDPIFAEVAYRLDDADWKTFEERQELMAKAAELSLKDSVRIWLVDQVSPFPYRKEIQVASDLASGLFSNPISHRTVRYKDRIGGTLKASDREVFVDPWNPFVGTNWAYDAHIIIATVDADYIYNPYTGLPMPNMFENATVEVLKGTQTMSSSPWLNLKFVDEIKVPTDAWYEWDSKNQQVIYAPEGTKARAKVVINYGDVLGKVKYHDGSVMTLADWLIPWPLDFERNDPDSPFYDESSAPMFASFKQIFCGWRIVSEHPLITEIYLNYSSLDAELILAQAASLTQIDSPTWGIANFWPSMPWHAKAIGMLAEKKGLLAMSADKADEMDVEWMNYIGGPSLAILKDMLEEAKSTGYVPFEKFASKYVSAEEVSARYANLEKWYNEHGHFWVGSGPFYLDSVDFTGHSALIKAFRDYRFKADRWAWLAQPPIPESTVTAPDSVVPGLKAEFQLSLSTMGQPYKNDRIDFVKYLVMDSAGNVMTKGEATPVAEGQWSIALPENVTGKMTPGTYTLVTIALSKDVAIPGVLKTPFVVIPELSYFQTLLAKTEGELNAAVSDLETKFTDEIAALNAAISASQTMMYAAIGISIVSLLVAIYAIISKK